LPLIYEYAFGGNNDEINPIGKGSMNKHCKIHNFALPQIEIEPLINKVTDQPIPAGFGPLLPHWREKENNDAITATNRAPKDQRFSQNFLIGEEILLNGFFPETNKELTIAMPVITPNLKIFSDQIQVTIPTCDTVIINTDTKHVSAVWRTFISNDLNELHNGILLIS
jgi:hypothetical protein